MLSQHSTIETTLYGQTGSINNEFVCSSGQDK